MRERPDVIIRPAESRDAAALGRLGALLVRLHHDFDPQRFIAAGPATEQGYGRFLASQLPRPDAVVLVAQRDGAVVGYAYATLEGPDWMALRGPAGVIDDILVDPAHRGGGVGRQLLERTLDALERLGAPRVVLFTATQNGDAQRLFASAGFRPTMIEMTRESGGGAQGAR